MVRVSGAGGEHLLHPGEFHAQLSDLFGAIREGDTHGGVWRVACCGGVQEQA
jgi:hypothetical protein